VRFIEHQPGTAVPADEAHFLDELEGPAVIRVRIALAASAARVSVCTRTRLKS
jgi:hypothetical protein